MATPWTDPEHMDNRTPSGRAYKETMKVAGRHRVRMEVFVGMEKLGAIQIAFDEDAGGDDGPEMRLMIEDKR